MQSFISFFLFGWILISPLDILFSSDSFEGDSENPRTYDDYEELKTLIKIHKNWIGQEKILCQPAYEHFCKPREPISVEIDSALVGIIHGKSPLASSLSGVAAFFAGGSCIFGLTNIFYAQHDIGHANKIKIELESNIKKYRKHVEELSEQDEISEDHLNYLEFYEENLSRFHSYLKEEKSSVFLNMVISCGTFFEFLGFIGSKPLLGHPLLYPDLENPAKICLISGLLIVSIGSLAEAFSVLPKLVKSGFYKLSGIEDEIEETKKEIQENILVKFEEDMKALVFSQKKDLSRNQKEQNLTSAILDLYKESLKTRAKERRHYNYLKFSGQISIGLGVFIFCLDKILHYQSSSVSIGIINTASAITVCGIILGLSSYFYYSKYIKTPPLAESSGLHDENKKIQRLQILGIILKKNIKRQSHKDFESSFTYFKQIAPIDSFSRKHRQPGNIQFHDHFTSQENSPTNITLHILTKLYKKGILYQVGNLLLDNLLCDKTLHTDSKCIHIDRDKKEGFIDWKQIVFDGFNSDNRNSHDLEKSKNLLLQLINCAIKVETKTLKEELNISIDQLIQAIP